MAVSKVVAKVVAKAAPNRVVKAYAQCGFDPPLPAYRRTRGSYMPSPGHTRRGAG